jgi:hypothetical protein
MISSRTKSRISSGSLVATTASARAGRWSGLPRSGRRRPRRPASHTRDCSSPRHHLPSLETSGSEAVSPVGGSGGGPGRTSRRLARAPHWMRLLTSWKRVVGRRSLVHGSSGGDVRKTEFRHTPRQDAPIHPSSPWEQKQVYICVIPRQLQSPQPSSGAQLVVAPPVPPMKVRQNSSRVHSSAPQVRVLPPPSARAPPSPPIVPLPPVPPVGRLPPVGPPPVMKLPEAPPAPPCVPLVFAPLPSPARVPPVALPPVGAPARLVSPPRPAESPPLLGAGPFPAALDSRLVLRVSPPHAPIVPSSANASAQQPPLMTAFNTGEREHGKTMLELGTRMWRPPPTTTSRRRVAAARGRCRPERSSRVSAACHDARDYSDPH